MQVLILAGGSGTRFWPLSRGRHPKQFLELEGDRSLLQSTIDRLQPLAEPRDVWICTTERLADAVHRQVPDVPADQVLLEPEGRNTAAAIGWSVRSMPAAARAGVVAVLPADHRIGDDGAFRRALETAARAVEERDTMLTLGVRPHRPETGYGY
ncbi:MAG: NTP transferase domain-containing protein, partial [Acidobacteria bacterium]|nr:NTP transferase domain-containing protein [Acidobacteriota bacterium]